MQKVSYKIWTNASGCIWACDSCAVQEICPENAIEHKFIGIRLVPVINNDKCNGCNKCLNVCPDNAVARFVGRYRTY
ncbi:MAG: 4Fe-4S binding protein [Proteobacteria bacterium]|nr:4Fe-4S binding protein [Pseudomonadota bacterium]